MSTKQPTVHLSEDELALWFIEEHKTEIRFVASRHKWMIYRRGVWITDETKVVSDMIRQCLRRFSKGQDSNEAKKIASARMVDAVNRLAQSDPKTSATINQWDTDPELLNTPTGTVDLRTGKIRAHNPGDYITKCTAVPRDGDYPLWTQFLSKITDGDDELVSYLKRIAGYAATGSTQEHALFFFYGTGANGKSVFLNTVSSILGDFARTANAETFTASKFHRHLTELAR